VGAGERELGRRRPRLPDVLADRGADQGVAEAQEEEVAPRLEVAVLVEDAVVRKEALAVEALDLALGADRAGVEEVAVEERRADERRDPGHLRGDLLEARGGSAQEARAEQEVLGRIAGDGKLGKEDEVGTRVARLVEPFQDALAIPVEVADDAVDLRERDPHAPILLVYALKAKTGARSVLGRFPTVPIPRVRVTLADRSWGLSPGPVPAGRGSGRSAPVPRRRAASLRAGCPCGPCPGDCPPDTARRERLRVREGPRGTRPGDSPPDESKTG
jgi:hypothetical protein